MSRIIIDPNICNSSPTIQGTRITVKTVLEFLSAGDGVEDVLEEYPSLSREDVLDCLSYSARLMGHHFSVQAVARRDLCSTTIFPGGLHPAITAVP